MLVPELTHRRRRFERKSVRVAQTKPITFRDVAALLERDSCVFCSQLRRFQLSCVVDGGVQGIELLCSFHTWAVAGAAESQRAAEIFLGLLEKNGLAEEQNLVERCDICERIGKQEAALTKNFSELLKDCKFREWLRDFGWLCLPHASRLLQHLSTADREVVLALVRKTAGRLKEDLSAVAADQGAGRGGPTAVSRAAEFLQGRRGLGHLALKTTKK